MSVIAKAVMMPTTLKNKYVARNLDMINEAVQHILVEEVDKQTMAAAIGAIKKLQNIDFSNVPTLSAARDAAVVDITRLAAGDDKKSVLQRIGAAFGKENGTIYTTLAFGSAIKNFFTMFNDYIDAVTTQNGKPANPNLRLEDIGGEDLHNAIRKFVETNFKPSGGIFKKFGSDWKQKYLGNSIDKVVDDIMFLNVGEIKKIIGDVRGATANVNQAAQAASQATPTQPSAEAPAQTPTARAQANAVDLPAGSTHPMANRNAKKPAEAAPGGDPAWDAVKDSVAQGGEEVAKSTISALRKAGLIK